MSSPASSLPITSPATEGEEEMVEVSLPIEAAPMPPNVHPWIRWVAEPRHISVVLAVLHAVLLVAGVSAVLIPDDHGYNAALGPATADTWGVLLTIGGIAGAVGALPGWWYIERVGLYLEMLGVLMWITALWIIQNATTAVLSFQTCLAVALVMALLNRYLRITGAGLDPRRGPGALATG